MTVSIIIPAYNAERYLAYTIESVLAQTLDSWELVIVNDGSDDTTAAIAGSHAIRDGRIRVVEQPNKGVAGARNRGFAEASTLSQYVAFLEDDDIWAQDALEALLSMLEAHPQLVAANGLSRVVDAQGQPIEPGELELWGRRRRGVVGRR